METALHSITTEIEKIIDREHISILHACESGSRAWGFASPDSDYDVRYIYVRTTNDYLNVFDCKDTIEEKISDEIDISGWDIKKALQLLYKSNAVLFEWLQSPIVYKSHKQFAEGLFTLAKDYFQPRTVTHHYLGIAYNALQSIQDNNTIKLKKYFYVLRPLLAALWVIQNSSIPPMEFGKLLPLIHDNKTVIDIINSLLDQKKVSDEKTVITLIPELQQFIINTFTQCEIGVKDFEKKDVPKEPLNIFFRNLLSQ